MPRPIGLLLVVAIALGGCSLIDKVVPIRPVMSREQAIAAAKAAEPDWANEGVLGAKLGTWAQFSDSFGPIEGPPPDPDELVWMVNLGWQHGPLNGQGVMVILDARDGRVLSRGSWIS